MWAGDQAAPGSASDGDCSSAGANATAASGGGRGRKARPARGRPAAADTVVATADAFIIAAGAAGQAGGVGWLGSASSSTNRRCPSPAAACGSGSSDWSLRSPHPVSERAGERGTTSPRTPSVAHAYTHTHEHTHAHARTRTNRHTHARTHARAHTHKQTHKHTREPAHVLDFEHATNALSLTLGSGPRYMIYVTLFCMLRESKNLRPCENCMRFWHGRRFFGLAQRVKTCDKI